MLRAVAVFLVLGRHVQPPQTGWDDRAAAAMNVWIRGGWIGVDLFFVLSGFLVSGLLFREHQQKERVSIGRFLVRRGLKIYPAFYAFFALTLLVIAFHWGDPALPATTIASELFFIQSYVPGVWGHTWSLAVEEHFYVLCAALFFVLTRVFRGRRDPFLAIPVVFGLMAVASLAARFVVASQPYSHLTHLFATHLRIDGLMFGVCLSYLWHFRRGLMDRLVRGRELLFGTVGVLMLLPAFVYELESTPFIYTSGLTVFYVGSGLLVLAVVSRGPSGNALVRALAKVGSYSYSIYLWHLFVLLELTELCDRYFDVDPRSPLAVGVYLGASIAVGIAMSKLVEYPVLRLRDRLFPSNAAALAEPAPSLAAIDGVEAAPAP